MMWSGQPSNGEAVAVGLVDEVASDGLGWGDGTSLRITKIIRILNCSSYQHQNKFDMLVK